MGIFITALAYSLTAAVLIIIHEAGHYLAGRIAGIPAHAIRIRLITFPQHVALLDREGWVSPSDYRRYVSATDRYLHTSGSVFAFIAGGPLFETAVVAIACTIAIALGYPKPAFVIASVALGLQLVYFLLFDLVLSWLKNVPAGDAAGLWVLSRIGAISVMLGIFATLGGLFWFSYSAYLEAA